MEHSMETDFQGNIILETEKITFGKKFAIPIALIAGIITYYVTYWLLAKLLAWLESNEALGFFNKKQGTSRPVHAFIVALIVYILVWYYLSTGELSSIFGHRMTIYVIRRMFAIVPIFFGISIITFATMNFVADPLKLVAIASPGHGAAEGAAARVEKLKKEWGLDKPAHVRYIIWLLEFITGYLGESFTLRRSVNRIIAEYAYPTLKLQYVAFIVSLAIAIPLGVLAAKYRATGIDATVSIIALIGLSMPIFVTGIMLIYFFGGAGLNWFPVSGMSSLEPVSYSDLFKDKGLMAVLERMWLATIDSAKHMTLPTVTLAFAGMAGYTRLVRAQMLEILRQDYILAARANGLPERDITWKHAFRNALIPIVTFVGLFVGSALAGAPITETVFTWPGLGYFYVSIALATYDYPSIISINMVITLMILVANLLTDITYVYLDPRIRI